MSGSRTQPIQVPSDWFVEMLRLEDAQYNQTTALNDKSGPKAAQQDILKESVTLSRQDVLTFFETCLATPEVSSAIERQVPYYYREPGDELPDAESGRIRGGFLRWWILTQLNVSAETFTKVQMVYTMYTANAFVEYFQSGRIKNAYDILHENMEREYYDIRVQDDYPPI